MPHRADPSGPVNGEPYVVRRRDHRLAGVQTHPHTHDRALRPAFCRQRALRLHRGGDRVAGTRERHEERVALSVDLVTAVTGTCSTYQAIVTRDNLRVALAKPAKQTRGPLDIGEQKRDRAAGQPRHGPWLRRPTAHVKVAERCPRGSRSWCELRTHAVDGRGTVVDAGSKRAATAAMTQTTATKTRADLAPARAPIASPPLVEDRRFACLSRRGSGGHDCPRRLRGAHEEQRKATLAQDAARD
jgi:hypothetical protein